MHEVKDNSKKYEEIIRRFYFDEYDPKVRTEAIESFARWFISEKESEERNEVFRRLFELEEGSDKSNEEEQERVKYIVNHIKKECCDVISGIKIEAKYDAAENTPKTFRLSPLKRLIRVAAVLIPLVILAGGLWIMTRDKAVTQHTEFAVQYGEKVNETLPDSSKVWINAGSTLTISQNKTRRIAELSGESYFDVTKDVERPFIVKTQDLTVTVLGTEFNVEAYPGSDVTTVTLNSGRIVINTVKNQQYVLEPNYQFIYTKSVGEGVVTNVEQHKVDEATLWKNGVLVLYDIKLDDALQIIERHFDVEVKVMNNTNLDNILMSKFDANTTLEDVMSCIQIAYPSLSYRIENKTLIIN